jgi:hypothetical protein
MTEIKVDPDQLKELADGIQKSEDKVDDALGKLSWTFSSFLVGITQANTGRIKDVQAELEHHMKKYQSKLDELQEGVMLTRAQILEADKNGWDKTGEFGLELLGVYDAERIFAEYDPVTGKKITGWQRAMATGMTLATLFPPAKGVLLLGKMGVKGLKALKLIENGAEVIKQTKNVLNPAVLKKMAQASYNTVIKGPIAKTSAYLKQTAENVKNIELSLNFNVFGQLNRFDPVLENVGQVPGKTVGEITEGIGKSAREMVGKAKDTIVRFSGKGTDMGKYQVGAYKDIKGVEGLDAHHSGQKAVMKKLVDNYDLNTGPAINVPKVGHTIKGPNGIVSRSTKGIDNPRQLLARDIMELRRVYDDIPNSALKELIRLNKKMYPEMRK